MPIYNKLIRDLIPEIIAKCGKTPVTRTLSNEEYLIELDRKLNEECAEYQADKSIEELADMLYTIEDLESVRIEKAHKRGGFEEKIFLKEVKES